EGQGTARLQTPVGPGIPPPVFIERSHVLSDRCIECICRGSSNCDASIGCTWSGGRQYCGPFHISEAYWIDAGRAVVEGGNPHAPDAFRTCATDYRCAASTMRLYVDKFQKIDLNLWTLEYKGVESPRQDCNGDGAIDCLDFALLHSQGGYGCQVADPGANRLYAEVRSCMSGPGFPPIGISQRASILGLRARREGKKKNRRNRSPEKEQYLRGSEEDVEWTEDAEWREGEGLERDAKAIDFHLPPPPDATDLGEGFEDCAKDLFCATETIKYYMRKFHADCDGNGVVNCLDYALIHSQGGYECRVQSPQRDHLYRGVEECLRKQQEEFPDIDVRVRPKKPAQAKP
ncbi:unnamed protein product, partial [Darwinula stevensoni]